MLYPLKFKPYMREMIWGGNRLALAGKSVPKGSDPSSIGESWELSGVDGHLSVASNGFLRNNNIEELIEVYMGELVGDGVYEEYGLEFPLLLKFIDSRDNLSVQVHPSDEFAAENGGGRGKTEMWYIVETDQGGAIYLDFNRKVGREEYLAAVADGSVEHLLHKIEVHKGDAFFVPSGTVHAICKGVLIAEIQETSDATYRIYDWGRVGKDGRPRELHTDLAVQVIEFTPRTDLNVTRNPQPNTLAELVSCKYFTVNLVNLRGTIVRDFAPLDSFVAYMCVEGEVQFKMNGEQSRIGALETVLIPAEACDVELSGTGRLLEIFVPDTYIAR
ncbi:MAG: type I phosphomannose isomerase catalytic subunit [Tidjanibacter sp.]|nr:type I phosphomannose isomerase catalytic subunit [Tidjanibacter sp.]